VSQPKNKIKIIRNKRINEGKKEEESAKEREEVTADYLPCEGLDPALDGEEESIDPVREDSAYSSLG
jgi:hypothetical protein